MIDHRPGRRNRIRAIIAGIFLLMFIPGAFIQEAGPGWRGLKRFATESTEVTEKKVEATPIENSITGFAYNKIKIK